MSHAAAASHLQINLETGFLHQIRATFATLGHPLLGDPIYAPPAVAAMSPRLLLHAQSLRLEEAGIEVHSPAAEKVCPKLQQKMTAEQPDPAVFFSGNTGE